jgi:hypothetical protein
MNRRISAALFLFLFALGLSCSHAQPIQVLSGPPQIAYRTLGMLSGQGENEPSAMAQVLEQASRLEADAVIIENRRPAGRVIIVTCRAIKYLAPPPVQ